MTNCHKEKSIHGKLASIKLSLWSALIDIPSSYLCQLSLEESPELWVKEFQYQKSRPQALKQTRVEDLK